VQVVSAVTNVARNSSERAFRHRAYRIFRIKRELLHNEQLPYSTKEVTEDKSGAVPKAAYGVRYFFPGLPRNEVLDVWLTWQSYPGWRLAEGIRILRAWFNPCIQGV
jgi:hypothetical protein